jgi:hypothetical protein
MRERPILFSSAMVRAILDGTKTQTRRKVRLIGADTIEDRGKGPNEFPWPRSVELDGCDYRTVLTGGTRLWVRETWGLYRPTDFTDWHRGSLAGASELPWGWELDYRADWGPSQDGCFWRPSIHMPRWASRITLEVVSVRVERLQDISNADAKAEGIERNVDDGVRYWGPLGKGHVDPRVAFRGLWEETYGTEAWALNPWVWVVTFRRVAP